MKNYCVGLAFNNDRNEILLIEKKVQNGKKVSGMV